MEANGKMRVLGPMLVRPDTTAWLTSSTSSASATSPPTKQNGPTRTPSPSLAPASTIAVACTSHFGIIRIQDHGADLSLGHHLTVHLRLTVESPGPAAAPHLAHMVVQLVAGQHRLAELGAVDPHEIDELRLVGRVEVADAQGARRLRQPLDDQHARHDREVREMALEERLVDAHALDADGALVGIHVDDAVHQEERVAVRQQLHHPRDVRRAELLLRRSGIRHCLVLARLPHPAKLPAGTIRRRTALLFALSV